MVYILDTLIELLFPTATPVRSLTLENPQRFLRVFRPHRHLGSTALTTYADPLVRAAILANKFHHDHHAAQLLAHLFTHWLSTLPDDNYLIIPMPLSEKRLRERGHNQVTTVAGFAESQHPLWLRLDILTRPHHTTAQTHRTKEERYNGLHGAFLAHKDSSLPPDTHLILLDDVITTGATMRAAKQALTTAYPTLKISSVAIAH